MTEPSPSSLDRRRADDDQHGGPFTITRAIPLWGLLTVLGALIGQGVVVYFAQQRQGELILAMTVELKQVVQAVNTSNVKDVEHDFRLSDHERRLQVLERERK